MTNNTDFRETLYTIDKSGKRKWVYPNLVRGFFFKRRLLVALSLILIYLSLPWIEVDGLQAVRFDLVQRKFIFFGEIFWATDTVFLFFILAGLALSLFFFTALFGRVWCGWACPETVFLEFIFRPIERLFEGNAASRLKLDTSPWTFNKVWRKAGKHLASAFCAWVIASSFLAYFLGSDVLLKMMSESPLDHLAPFALTVIFMLLFAFQFGWFREQFCTVLCPYARFQSVLMDTNSIVVGYDALRGEPRGKLGKGQETVSGHGDCIDCGLCVRVCPTGIDIRNGLQLECISCTACIDACDSIMQKIGKPPGLVRYATENNLSGKPTRIVRPRVAFYSLIAVAYFSAFGYLFAHRQLSEFSIVRGAADKPFSLLPNGNVSNHLHLRISNKSRQTETYAIQVSSIDNQSQVSLITPVNPVIIDAESMMTVPVYFNFSASFLRGGKLPVQVKVSNTAGFEKSTKVILLGPGE